MRKYCLTYDVKDSDKWLSNEIRLKILEVLMENDITDFESPVASTILFEDGHQELRLSHWNYIISTAFIEDLYYYLCLVAIDKTSNGYFDRNEGNRDLNNNFQQAINNLR